jgi:hypothetical protein
MGVLAYVRDWLIIPKTEQQKMNNHKLLELNLRFLRLMATGAFLAALVVALH